MAKIELERRVIKHQNFSPRSLLEIVSDHTQIYELFLAATKDELGYDVDIEVPDHLIPFKVPCIKLQDYINALTTKSIAKQILDAVGPDAYIIMKDSFDYKRNNCRMLPGSIVSVGFETEEQAAQAQLATLQDTLNKQLLEVEKVKSKIKEAEKKVKK